MLSILSFLLRSEARGALTTVYFVPVGGTRDYLLKKSFLFRCLQASSDARPTVCLGSSHFYYAGGCAGDDGIFRNILADQGVGPDDRIISDSNPIKNCGPSPDPAIFADMNPPSDVHILLDDWLGGVVDRMIPGTDVGVGGDKGALSNADLTLSGNAALGADVAARFEVNSPAFCYENRGATDENRVLKEDAPLNPLLGFLGPIVQDSKFIKYNPLTYMYPARLSQGHPSTDNGFLASASKEKGEKDSSEAHPEKGGHVHQEEIVEFEPEKVSKSTISNKKSSILGEPCPGKLLLLFAETRHAVPK